MNTLINYLSEKQVDIVTAPLGEVHIINEVLAGPGSGKTRVLTYRIAYLIAALEIPPYQIMAVTFTNKAAREMSNRVQNLLGEKADGLWIGTFHAICGRILRREAAQLPVDSNFVIYDADDQLALIKRVIQETVYNNKDYNPRQVLARISNAKNDLLGPEEYPLENYRDETIKKIYAAYQKYLVSSNAMDFDDMLMYSVMLLKNNPNVLKKYINRFRHILVDEFQDTNKAQYEFIRLLSSKKNGKHSVFVVGDEDQAIYSWRGADSYNMQRLLDDFPNANKLDLLENYRSMQTILDVAMSIIDKNKNRTKKALVSKCGKGEPVVIYEATDDTDEAAYVVETISRQVKKGQASESDFAIMYRTNAQSRLLEEAFRRANMSYRLVGAQRFYGRREVKDIIAFLRLIYNPKDEVSLNRVINLPPRGIGAVTLDKLQTCAQEVGISSGEVLLSLNEEAGSPYENTLGSAAIRLRPFSQLLLDWRKNAHKTSLTTLFDQVVLDTGYEAYIKANSDDLQDRWANILELRSVLLEYEERGLAEFLEAMALVADQDTLPDTIDAPTLLTLHAAKGLEFPQVFIIGLDEHTLPHSRSRDDPEELAEERRLFYVGITRAEDRLYLVRARRRRSPYGGYEPMQPSRFLLDIPDKLLNGYFSRSSNDDDPYDLNQYQWDRTYTPTPKAKVTQKAETREQRFHPEMHVQHPVYGEGVVRNSRLEYGDETVEVYFEGLGLKALVASLSRLDILEK